MVTELSSSISKFWDWAIGGSLILFTCNTNEVKSKYSPSVTPIVIFILPIDYRAKSQEKDKV